MNLPNTGDFPYTSDIGTSSLAQLQALCQSSDIGFTVTSGYRNVAGQNNGWHLYSNAIDVVTTQADMTQLANYLEQYYPFLLELIHTNPDGSGSYVKNGHISSAQYYGADTVAQHTDHIHVAGTVSSMQAAARWAQQRNQNPDDPKNTKTGSGGGFGGTGFPLPASGSGGSTPTGTSSTDSTTQSGLQGCLSKMGFTTAGAALLTQVAWEVAHRFL